MGGVNVWLEVRWVVSGGVTGDGSVVCVGWAVWYSIPLE